MIGKYVLKSSLMLVHEFANLMSSISIYFCVKADDGLTSTIAYVSFHGDILQKIVWKRWRLAKNIGLEQE